MNLFTVLTPLKFFVSSLSTTRMQNRSLTFFLFETTHSYNFLRCIPQLIKYVATLFYKFVRRVECARFLTAVELTGLEHIELSLSVEGKRSAQLLFLWPCVHLCRPIFNIYHMFAAKSTATLSIWTHFNSVVPQVDRGDRLGLHCTFVMLPDCRIC